MDTITKFLEQKKASGLSKSTIKSYKMILGALDTFKPIDTIEKDDLVKFFNRKFGSDATKFLYAVSIKTFFKEIGKPEIASWLKAKRPKETLTSDDILTSDEVQAMIDCTDSHYWKSLIAVLYESGARISEVLSLRWKDIVLGKYTMKDHDGIERTIEAFQVNIPTQKTAAGFRKMILPDSTSYLLNLKEIVESKPDNHIFYFSYKCNYDTLGEIGRRAKLSKHVHPHLFRHSRATAEIQKGSSEPVLRKMLGWSSASTVPSRYIHLSDSDVIDNQLGKVHEIKNGHIKTAEKIDVKTAFDEIQAVKEENRELNDRYALLNTYVDRFAESNLILMEFIYKITGNDDIKKRIDTAKEIQDALERCKKDVERHKNTSKTVQDAPGREKNDKRQ